MEDQFLKMQSDVLSSLMIQIFQKERERDVDADQHSPGVSRQSLPPENGGPCSECQGYHHPKMEDQFLKMQCNVLSSLMIQIFQKERERDVDADQHSSGGNQQQTYHVCGLSSMLPPSTASLSSSWNAGKHCTIAWTHSHDISLSSWCFKYIRTRGPDKNFKMPTTSSDLTGSSPSSVGPCV